MKEIFYLNKIPAFIIAGKCVILTLLFFSMSGIASRAEEVKSPVDYVRPQIDSHKSRWFYFASAQSSLWDGQFESGHVGERELEFGLFI